MNKSTEHIIGINELKKMTSLVNVKYGFDFSHYATSSFRRRIIRILELHSFKDFDSLMLKIENDEEFYQLFLKEVTVNTTEMFRDPTMWKSLRKDILEQLKLKESISIWHAGCSSGEEVYSMTILLKEMGIYDRVKLYATDINTKVIETAKAGVFPLRNMELNEENYEKAGGTSDFRNYYTQESGNAKMDTTLLGNVTFQVHNLVQDDPFSKFDLILCRNVMIYFDKILQNNVFKLFYDSLHLRSYFVIGSKESMVWCSISNKFKVINEKERIYQVIT